MKTGEATLQFYPSPVGEGWSAQPTGRGMLQKQESDPTRPLAALAATFPLQGRDGEN